MGKTIHRPTTAAMAALMDYHWPGKRTESRVPLVRHDSLQRGHIGGVRPCRPIFSRRIPRLTPPRRSPPMNAADLCSPSDRPEEIAPRPHVSLGMSRATFYRRLTELELPSQLSLPSARPLQLSHTVLRETA